MPQPNDLSRSLVALDQDSTIIAVVEMSQSSWLVAGMLPGIADARVHALAAGGAMDMGGIAEQERATLAEVLRHPMMHVIGGEPIDLDLEVIDRPAANVVELQRIGTVGTLVANGSDETSPAFAGQREDGEEIGLVEIDVQFAVDRGTGSIDVGDVEELPIGPAAKAGAERFAHPRVRTVAAGDVGCLAVLFMPIRPAKAGGDAIALVGEAYQLRSTLYCDAELLQPLDQQPLVLVLREDL